MKFKILHGPNLQFFMSKILKMLPYALSESKNILHIQPASSFAERVPHDSVQPFGATETAI